MKLFVFSTKFGSAVVAASTEEEAHKVLSDYEVGDNITYDVRNGSCTVTEVRPDSKPGVLHYQSD